MVRFFVGSAFVFNGALLLYGPASWPFWLRITLTFMLVVVGLPLAYYGARWCGRGGALYQQFDMRVGETFARITDPHRAVLEDEHGGEGLWVLDKPLPEGKDTFKAAWNGERVVLEPIPEEDATIDTSGM